MGWASKKRDQLIFLFFTFNWLKVKDFKEIANRKAKKHHSFTNATTYTHSQFSNNNWPKHLDPSSLNSLSLFNKFTTT